MITCVQAAPIERPSRHSASGVYQAPPAILPSMVEAMGRSTCVAFSAFDGTILVGHDVAPPQRWDESRNSFMGYSAGLATNGTTIQFPNRKTVGIQESPSFASLLTGANGSGGVWRRAIGANRWQLITTGFYGEVQDGGSTDPRRTKRRLVLIDGTNVFIACRRTAAPAFGVIRSVDSGASYAAWSFATSRNFTAMVKSPQYECIYAGADVRGGAATDGVYILTGLAGTAVVTRIDNVGTGAPGAGMLDVRDVAVVREGTTDAIYVVVGNKAGSDANRGLWRCRIAADPAGGGFSAAASCTWSHILTPGASDRINCVVAFQPNGASTTPTYLLTTYHDTLTNATGTYDLSPDAGGTTESYRIVAQRSLNGEAVTPTWTVISNATNINILTYGTQHVHAVTYAGEAVTERGRFGGSLYSSTDLAISADGARVVSTGKSSPWVCDNPWDTTPIWRPLSKGLGGLEGGYANVQVPGETRVAHTDDDRGGYTYGSPALGYRGPVVVMSSEFSGFIGSDNASNCVQLDPTNNMTLRWARDLDGFGYVTTDAWSNGFAQTTQIGGAGGSGKAIGHYRWQDSTAAFRVLIVTSTGIWRDSTQVATIASSATRTEFVVSGVNCWLAVPDLGIFRSVDDGVTWVLWWDRAIPSTTTSKIAGHVAKDRDVGATLWIAFDDGGVWKATTANLTAPGSGVAGSRPANTTKITGGALPLGTEPIGPIAVDQVRGDVWACGYSPTGAARPGLYVLRHEDQTAWVQDPDITGQYGEQGLTPSNMSVMDGRLLIGTVGNGTLRRMT